MRRTSRSWSGWTGEQRMTPHQALEGMLELEKIFGDKLSENFKVEAWPDIFTVLKDKVVHFEFGVAVPAQEHLTFANDLMDKGLFRLPFNAVFMTGNCSPKCGILAMNHSDDTKHPLTVIVFAGVNVGDRVRIDAAPLFAITIDHTDGDDSRVRWVSLTKEGTHQSRRTGDWKDDAALETSAQVAMQLAMGWPVLLMSKDVETIKLEAPERLNRARALKGKLPIGERMIVRIRPEARERQRQALEDHRASPRMHWRRGHFRQLHEKHGGQIIPIAPMIINASDEAKPIAKQYKLG